MSGALPCLLLFMLQLSAGSGGVLLLSKVDDLLTNAGGPEGDLLWTAGEGILQGPEPHLQQIWSPSGSYVQFC